MDWNNYYKTWDDFMRDYQHSSRQTRNSLLHWGEGLMTWQGKLEAKAWIPHEGSLRFWLSDKYKYDPHLRLHSIFIDQDLEEIEELIDYLSIMVENFKKSKRYKDSRENAIS